MKKATILTIEDDHNLQIVMQSFLEDQGYEVLTGSSGHDLLEKVQATHVDVILLDLVLPDSDGLNLMNQIRAYTQAPVIMVSGKCDPTDKILGLELGADDYIGKPFQMRELYARIKAVLRRAGQDMSAAVRPALGRQDAPRLSFGDWVMDRSSFSVIDRQGKTADLTAAEFRLLEILLNGAGRVLTRDQLFELSRGQDYHSYDRAVDIQVARLRRKLGDDPKMPHMIKTVRGVGYMFCQPVTVLAENVASSR